MFDIGGTTEFFSVTYTCVHMPVFNVCKAQ